MTTIDGVGVSTVMTVIGEIGTDLTPWRSDKAFGSWLGLSPNQRKSGNRVISSATRPIANRCTNAFRMAAQALSNSKSALGAFYRRLRARIGAPKAITAAAYKIARIWYRMLTTKQPYEDVGQAAYDARFAERRLQGITRAAKDLGYKLTPA
ncbi:MAG: IS110 family transposase [Okeania sp. SIO3B3]|nr:IS110 family transposase [Okeania sp. SIO3B3]